MRLRRNYVRLWIADRTRDRGRRITRDIHKREHNQLATPPNPKSTSWCRCRATFSLGTCGRCRCRARTWHSSSLAELNPSPISAAVAGGASHINVRSRRTRAATCAALARSPRSKLSAPPVPTLPLSRGPSEGRHSPRSQLSAPPFPPSPSRGASHSCASSCKSSTCPLALRVGRRSPLVELPFNRFPTTLPRRRRRRPQARKATTEAEAEPS